MLVFRIALLFGLLFLLWAGWRRLTRAAPRGPAGTFQPTVRCQQCGVVLPRESAQRRDDQWFCADHAPPR